MVVNVILILAKTIIVLKCGDKNVNICQQVQVVPATKFVLKV